LLAAANRYHPGSFFLSRVGPELPRKTFLLIGPKLDSLEKLAATCAAAVEKRFPGETEILFHFKRENPGLELTVLPREARRRGLTAKEVQHQISWTFGRPITGSYLPRGENEEREIYLTSHPRLESFDPGNFPLKTSSGRWVPLSAVARQKELPRWSTIYRTNGNRTLGITFRYTGSKGGGLQDITSFITVLPLPENYYIMPESRSISMATRNTRRRRTIGSTLVPLLCISLLGRKKAFKFGTPLLRLLFAAASYAGVLFAAEGGGLFPAALPFALLHLCGFLLAAMLLKPNKYD
jgi:multidrug efflux pump subunit AcrB